MTSVALMPEAPRADPVSVAKLLLQAGRDVEISAHGGSMSPTIPRDAMLRIRRADPTVLATGDVISFDAGDTLLTHRIVALVSSRWGTRHAYVLARGDAATICDMPVPMPDVLGVVSAYRVGDEWHAIPPTTPRPGWRGPASTTLAVAVRIALPISLRLAKGLVHAARWVAWHRARILRWISAE